MRITLIGVVAVVVAIVLVGLVVDQVHRGMNRDKGNGNEQSENPA